MTLSHDIPAAAAWSLTLRAGRVLRFTALEDGAVCIRAVCPQPAHHRFGAWHRYRYRAERSP